MKHKKKILYDFVPNRLIRVDEERRSMSPSLIRVRVQTDWSFIYIFSHWSQKGNTQYELTYKYVYVSLCVKVCVHRGGLSHFTNILSFWVLNCVFWIFLTIFSLFFFFQCIICIIISFVTLYLTPRSASVFYYIHTNVTLF